MRLKKGFITYETDEEQMVVPTGNVKFNGFLRNNKTAAFIVECLKKDTTMNHIVEAICDKYEVAEEVVRKDVERILETLKTIGALEDC